MQVQVQSDSSELVALGETDDEFMDVSLVSERLYLGAEDAVLTPAWLVARKVTHVINVGGAQPPSIEGFVGYKRIQVADQSDSDLLSHFDDCYDFIQSALDGDPKAVVLLHCRAGISRSATIMTAYLMRKHRWSRDQALREVRAVRNVWPNAGFLKQLRDYQSVLEGWFSDNDEQDTTTVAMTVAVATTTPAAAQTECAIATASAASSTTDATASPA
jgi:hypothetical protein